jgi:NADPH2:quinone reductase
MHKVVTNAFGSLDDLELVEQADLEPAPGQVVVDIEAAGVNFVDALLVQGRYQITPPLPYTPGSEVAGTVKATGDGVDGIDVGQRVLALPASGGYATQVAVPAPAVVAIPDTLSAGQAAGLVQSYATMLYALTRRTTVSEGEWFAVLGAGGGIGLAAIDIASSLGANVVACASTAEKLALAESVGAVATIAYDDVDLKTAVREVTGGGADCVVDPVGGDKAESALRSLRFGGRYLVLGFAAGQIPRLPLNQVLLNSRSIIGIEWGAWVLRDPAGNQALLAELMQMVADGRVHPVEPSVRPLSEAATVLAEIQSRQISGKVVLTPGSRW